MAKQIPELDIIATPTAGQESIIETVVARHDTYATSRMTLAQIFTLGSISGAIKSALDTLSGLIAGNTSSINTLSTNKLDKVGTLRTWLTIDKAIRVNHTGDEEYFSWTTTQVVWFDSNGMPIPVTPTVDIHWLSQKITPVWNDELIISDSDASYTNKRVLMSAVMPKLGWSWSDWALSISSGTTTLTFDAQWFVEKNYTTLTISGGTLNFSTPTNFWWIAIIKVQWDCSITGGTIDISSMWAAGWATWVVWNQWMSSFASILTTKNGWFRLAKGLWVWRWQLIVYCGGGGWWAESTGWWVWWRGGWWLYIEVWWSLTFSTPATINANWAAWTNNSSWGGGGGGGCVVIISRTTISQTWTITVNWWAWWNSSASTVNTGWSWAWSYSAGWNAIYAWPSEAWTSNSFWSGWAAWTWPQPGGGGWAWFYQIN